METTSDKYQFSADWFSVHIPVWQEYLGHLKGCPDLRYLEIGVNEGRSLVWMFENILTHPSCRATGIDLFPENEQYPAGMEKTTRANLEAGGFSDRAALLKGTSHRMLRPLPVNSYDIIYVDGGHRAKRVLSDTVLSWDLLKENGIMIFDDYLWEVGNLPEAERPQIAIDAFLKAYGNEITIIHQGWQIIIRRESRRKNPPAQTGPLSR